ncbi:hypothetical protein G9A89_014104 [Geosiphon pyriformis]|nr:hypothetical protein G9A89_014104 [Geosiphon pyriformis]
MDFWNWFLNEHSAETYTAYTTYYFDQAYFENNFEERNNSINQLLYSATFKQQPPDFEYLNHQIHIWIAAHQATETPFETEEESYQTAPVFDLLSTGLADNSNITPLICKAQVAGYFIDLILDSGSSVSVIAKHFLEAIGRKIDEPSTRPMTNVHGDKKKGLGIAKAIPVCINGISIETDMEVSKAKKYTIIVGNEWLKKAKALLDYEFCELTIKCGEKLIVVKLPKQSPEENESDESDDEESEEEEEQEETAELAYTIFTSNGKPLDNVKADKKKIIVNGKLICWPYYDMLKRTFDRKPGKKAKYSYWWHSPCARCWCDKPLYSPKVQKSFENKPPEIQSLVVEQRELSPEERKVDIENLLARNSPVISKEGEPPGHTHVIQHTIITRKTRPIYLKPYQSN